MEIDIIKAAFEIKKHLAAAVPSEPMPAESERIELLEKMESLKAEINKAMVGINKAMVGIIDRTLDPIPNGAAGVYGASKYTKFRICKDSTPWMNLSSATDGTTFMIRYETTRRYYDQRFPDEPIALTFSDMHTVFGPKEYLASVRRCLRDICKAADSDLTNDLESFIATYLSHDDRYLPAVRAAFIEREGRYFAYVIWK